MAVGARSVLITGCNRGIGLELVKQLLAKPNGPKQIFATCRDPKSPQCQELNKLAAEHCNLEVIKLEVMNEKCAKEAAKEVEKRLKGAGLNVLINNAGILQPSTLETVDAEDMLHLYTTNVVGPLEMTKVITFHVKDLLPLNTADLNTRHAQALLADHGIHAPTRITKEAFLPLLKKAAKENPAAALGSGKAVLLNMSALLGSIAKTHDSFDWIPVLSYRCSKAALNMLTNCQAFGYKPDGILCVAIHPGWVNTDMGGDKADITVQESVKGIVNVLYNLSEKQNGLLVDWKGDIIPW